MKRVLPFVLLVLFMTGIVMGDEVAMSRRRALRELTERADSGDAKAIFQYARILETGYDTIEQDTLRSMALYLKAAGMGYAPALNFVGFRYYNGEIVKQDTDSALYWIRKAAEAGDITGASNMGYLLSQGEGVVHDYAEAVKWLTKAAEQGVPSAMSQLGDLNRQGLGIDKDTLAAVGWYEKAAVAGDIDSQFKLVAMMMDKWKELPVDSAMAMGKRYYLGGMPVAGVELLEHVADTGDPLALTLMGDAYSKGAGVRYDYQEALQYFHRGAEGGNPSAQFILAEMLEFFPDTFSEHDAAYWYEKAAEAGVTDSETAYGRLYTLP